MSQTFLLTIKENMNSNLSHGTLETLLKGTGWTVTVLQPRKQFVHSACQSSWSLLQKLCVLVYRNECFFLQARSASTSSFRSVSQVMKRKSLITPVHFQYWAFDFVRLVGNDFYVLSKAFDLVEVFCDQSFIYRGFHLNPSSPFHNTIL